MNQAALLATLEAETWCGGLMKVTDLNVTEANGAQLFRQDYFEVNATTNCAQATSANFYVLNAGQPNETAYWFQKAPAQQLG